MQVSVDGVVSPADRGRRQGVHGRQDAHLPRRGRSSSSGPATSSTTYVTRQRHSATGRSGPAPTPGPSAWSPATAAASSRTEGVTVADAELRALAERLQAACLEARPHASPFAESCTGGRVGDALTDIPGSSGYVRGGIVAYADDTKVALLGVPRGTLRGARRRQRPGGPRDGRGRPLPVRRGPGRLRHRDRRARAAPAPGKPVGPHLRGVGRRRRGDRAALHLGRRSRGQQGGQRARRRSSCCWRRVAGTCGRSRERG